MAKPALILMGLLAAIPGAFADPLWQDELNWLKIMAFAAHQTDYSGTFLYQYGNHVEISRITHVVDRDGEHSRLESLDGVRHEIILNNGQVLCYLGGRKVKLKEHQGTPRTFPALLPEQLSLLNENYQIKQGEEGKVAGFHAHAMIFQPKDNLRYIHKMWAHSDSGLLLKAEVLDDRSRVIEQNTFIQLNMDGNIDRSWIVAGTPDAVLIARQQRHTVLPKTEAMAGSSGWQVDMLPAGFKKITEVRRPMLGKKAPVIQLVFSDGLAGISVFIESSDGDQDDHTGLSSQGAVQVYSKVAGNYLVTVVGEVPPRTVMRVADSVRYGGQ
ncbi:MAG: MucB/RseB C-terminal domain-containing protein [Betaproteobacteria bacterium]|nr:MucB/RseB C-terminal domain-containing protein [Betaproteobacteria bacterium]